MEAITDSAFLVFYLLYCSQSTISITLRGAFTGPNDFAKIAFTKIRGKKAPFHYLIV